MLFPSEGNHTKKKKHKEAQSPKKVESGEFLYRCDPGVGHSGALCLVYPYRSSSLSSLKTGPPLLPPVPWLGPLPPAVLVGNLPAEGNKVREWGGQMAERLGSRANNQKVVGSIPGRAK